MEYEISKQLVLHFPIPEKYIASERLKDELVMSQSLDVTLRYYYS